MPKLRRTPTNSEPRRRRLRWPVGLYQVVGESMLPTYQPGNILLGWRWFRARPGQVVVARYDRPLIKRIRFIEGNNVWLEGDNAAHSNDSRHFGTLAREQIEAVILPWLVR